MLKGITDFCSPKLGAIKLYRKQRAPGSQNPTFLFLHALGARFKEFEAIWSDSRFSGHGVIGFDFPGHGASISTSGKIINVNDLAELTLQVTEHFNVQPLIVIGHSLGGIVALKAIEKGLAPAGFVNIEGNLTSEDCGYVSRRSAGVSYDAFLSQALPALRTSFATSERPGDRHYAQGLASIDARQFHAYCADIVRLSDSGALLESFIEFPGAKLHIRGADTPLPTYAERLKDTRQVEIPNAGHFTFIDNAPAVNEAIYSFLDDHHILGAAA